MIELNRPIAITLNIATAPVVAMVVAVAVLGLLVGSSHAQYRNVSASLNSEASLRRLGVVRAWQTQIEYDASRGKLAGLAQYISDQTAQTIYEVTYPGGRLTFSDRDLDAFHKPLGPRGAKAKAEEWVEIWKTRTKSKAEPEITGPIAAEFDKEVERRWNAR